MIYVCSLLIHLTLNQKVNGTMQERIKVWDAPLRIFHWILVVSFFTAYMTEEDFLETHILAGYVVFGLLPLRLLWGFIGSNYARFREFVCGFQTAFHYVQSLCKGNAKRYIGHNPAGALMIVIMLLFLLLTTVSGFAVYGADQQAGPLYFIASTQKENWEELHEFFANVTLGLVIIHVIGVITESILHRENLISAMFHGYKNVKTSQLDKID